MRVYSSIIRTYQTNQSLWGFRIFRLAILGIILLSQCARGAEISVSVEADSLIIAVKEIHYPISIIDKELKSGLPNNISLMISIFEKDNLIFGSTNNYQLTYDLWDEIYNLQITKESNWTETKVLGSQQEVQQFIKNLTFSSDRVLTLLQHDKDYHLQSRIIINPVKSEQITKIKAWIASSQGHEPDGAETKGVSLSANSTPAVRNAGPDNNSVTATTIINQRADKIGSVRPRFQKLFDQILEQYITENEIPALWNSEVFSLEFNLAKLKLEQSQP